MDKSATASAQPSLHRSAYLGGLAIAIGGAVLFSTKAVVAKLLYRYQIDAVTLIAFRMIFSLPVFAAVALWKMRTEAPLSNADRWRLIGLGLIGEVALAQHAEVRRGLRPARQLGHGDLLPLQ
eukprot:gene31997-39529_t